MADMSVFKGYTNIDEVICEFWEEDTAVSFRPVSLFSTYAVTAELALASRADQAHPPVFWPENNTPPLHS